MFSRYLRFRVDFLVIWKNGLIKKIWLISKFMTSQTEQQIITIHMLFNISRCKGNQTMKFGQIDEHNTRNIFLEKSYKKRVGKATPTLFYEKSTLSIYLDQQSEM